MRQEGQASCGQAGRRVSGLCGPWEEGLSILPFPALSLGAAVG